MFTIKALLRSSPFYILFCTGSVLLPLFAYAISVADTLGCFALPADSRCEPLAFPQALWLMMMTVFTIGYGRPYTPNTAMGSFLAAVAAVTYVIVLSLLIAFSRRGLKLTPKQALVLDYYDKVNVS